MDANIYVFRAPRPARRDQAEGWGAVRLYSESDLDVVLISQVVRIEGAEEDSLLHGLAPAPTWDSFTRSLR